MEDRSFEITFAASAESLFRKAFFTDEEVGIALALRLGETETSVGVAVKAGTGFSERHRLEIGTSTAANFLLLQGLSLRIEPPYPVRISIKPDLVELFSGLFTLEEYGPCIFILGRIGEETIRNAETLSPEGFEEFIERVLKAGNFFLGSNNSDLETLFGRVAQAPLLKMSKTVFDSIVGGQSAPMPGLH